MVFAAELSAQKQLGRSPYTPGGTFWSAGAGHHRVDTEQERQSCNQECRARETSDGNAGVYCLTALQVTEPDALHPGRLNVQFMVPLAWVCDWNEPEIVLVVKVLPVIGIDVAGPEVMVTSVGQFNPRFGKLTP
jgi:hypothetical protein